MLWDLLESGRRSVNQWGRPFLCIENHGERQIYRLEDSSIQKGKSARNIGP